MQTTLYCNMLHEMNCNTYFAVFDADSGKHATGATSTSGQENGAPSEQAAQPSNTHESSFPSSWPPHSVHAKPQAVCTLPCLAMCLIASFAECISDGVQDYMQLVVSACLGVQCACIG